LFFLFITTSILVKYGFKKALLFGLLAMLFRYISLYSGVVANQEWLYIVGVLMHGLIFGLFFVAGQVYTDKVAPPELKAQAQGFLTFVIWGLGILAGNLVSSQMIERLKVDGHTDWSLIFLISSISTAVMIVLVFMFFKNPTDLSKKNADI
jgi:MFS family permease